MRATDQLGLPLAWGDEPPPDILDLDTEGRTLLEAQQQVLELADKGSRCPCCGRRAQVYRRKLNSGMAIALIWLVQRYAVTGDWVNVQEDAPRKVLRSKQLGTTRHWGLVEPMPHDPEDTARKTSGHWRPTERGIAFVHSRVMVPAKVHLYDDRVVGWSEANITIRGALGARFDYSELMEAGVV